MTGYGPHGSSLRDLPRLRSTKRRRVSSYDTSGGNNDYVVIKPGETAEIAAIPGAGDINHIWMTVASHEGQTPDSLDGAYMRKIVLKAYWDGCESPSILAPLGDFFGMGHARTGNFSSAPLQMSPEDGKGLNSWWHMPFANGARFEITNECTEMVLRFYYYIDYEAFDELEDGLGRFHASWNRENPTDGIPEEGMTNGEYLFGSKNTTGDGNYTILETTGRGHYVGCTFSTTNLRHSEQWNWYGEGDDMIFVDGEPWPPNLHGTGTEDYFNTAWCPTQTFHGPYHGITLAGGENWSGQISYYRFHVEDPITFEESIKVTIEHGHNNHRNDDISSVAYWYQDTCATNLTLAPVERRLPRLG